GHDLLRVEKDRGRLVCREVAVAGSAATRRDRVGPGRRRAIEQRISGRLREDERRTAEPDVGLGIGALRAHAVVHVLRSHVEPAHVDIGMQRFEPILEQRQQVSTMGTVDDEWGAVVSRTAKQSKCERTNKNQGVGSEEWYATVRTDRN